MATDQELVEFAALSDGGSVRGQPIPPKVPDIFKTTPQAAEAWTQFERDWVDFFKKLQFAAGSATVITGPVTASIGEPIPGPPGPPGPAGDITIVDPPEISVGELGLQRQIFVSFRGDGRPGVGTHSSPFDGSTLPKFDAVMNAVPDYSEVILLPAVYETAGFDLSDVNSWKVKTGCRLRGCGIERTTVKMMRGSNAAGYYVVINGTNVPWSEVVDLTIDCNGDAFPLHPTIHACHLSGHHARIAGVRVTNVSGGDTWELFTLVVAGDTVAGKTDANLYLERCVVDTIVWMGNAAGLQLSVFGGGDVGENVIHGTIRDCFVDGTFKDGFIHYLPDTLVGFPVGRFWGNAIGFSPGTNMVIENNHFRNCGGAGPYQDTWNRSRSDITIRNNSYYNVQVGPNFNFDRYRKHKRIIIENNDISLQSTLGKTPSSVHARGITLVDNATMASGVRLFEEIIVRGNHFRFVGESMDKAQLSVGIQVSSADTLIIEDNLIRLPNKIAGSAFNDIWTWNIGRLQCRNNRRPEDNSIILPWNAEKSLYREDAEYEQVKAHGFQALGF